MASIRLTKKIVFHNANVPSLRMASMRSLNSSWNTCKSLHLKDLVVNVMLYCYDLYHTVYRLLIYLTRLLLYQI